jgi:hypothetical protein
MILFKKLVLLLGLLLTTILWFALASPVVAELPPRPPIEPKHEQPQPQGAAIRLWIENSAPSLWTEIQWQDTQGNWHKVDGWRGTLDDDNTKQWWVGPEIFAAGPFRWLVYDTEGGTLVASSLEFYLPVTNRQLIDILLTLPEQ